jgi:hypothetical protein
MNLDTKLLQVDNIFDSQVLKLELLDSLPMTAPANRIVSFPRNQLRSGGINLWHELDIAGKLGNVYPQKAIK